MPKFYINKKSRLNLIELSDIFRRSAANIDNKALALELVDATRRIVCLSTHYMPEYPDLYYNRDIDKKIKTELAGIVKTASQLKISEIILPFEDHKDFWQAQRIKDNILETFNSSAVKVRLHKGEYKKDNAPFGDIDPQTKTALDTGLRGMAAINDDLKGKWDYPHIKF